MPQGTLYNTFTCVIISSWKNFWKFPNNTVYGPPHVNKCPQHILFSDQNMTESEQIKTPRICPVSTRNFRLQFSVTHRHTSAVISCAVMECQVAIAARVMDASIRLVTVSSLKYALYEMVKVSFTEKINHNKNTNGLIYAKKMQNKLSLPKCIQINK